MLVVVTMHGREVVQRDYSSCTCVEEGRLVRACVVYLFRKTVELDVNPLSDCGHCRRRTFVGFSFPLPQIPALLFSRHFHSIPLFHSPYLLVHRPFSP